MGRLDPRRLPLIGDDVAQVGQVYDILTSPCEANPYIAAYAFFQYTPMLMWSLFKPDPFDQVQERFGMGHKRKRKRNWRPADIDIDPKNTGKGLRWASWFGTKMLERVGWYFLIVDATTDFFVNWTSMAYEYSGCTVAGTPHTSRRRIVTQSGIAVPGWFQVGIGDLVSQNIWTSSVSSLACNTNGPKQFGGSVQFVNPPQSLKATISAVEIRFVPQDGGPTLTFPAEPSVKFQTPNRSWSWYERAYNPVFPRGQVQIWAFNTTTGWWNSPTANLSATGTLDLGFKADP